MKFLKKLASLFSSPDEETPETEEKDAVPVEEVETWLDKLKRSEFDGARQVVERSFMKISDAKESLGQHLKELEAAELQNPNVPPREKQLMEGNRAAYIKQHELFSQYIKQPKELHLETVMEFCDMMREQMEKLAKSSARSHLILGEFVANNTKLINRDMKSIADGVSEMSGSIGGSRFSEDNLLPVLKSVQELKAKMKLLSDIRQDLSQLDKKLASSKSLKKKIESDIDELKTTDSYKRFSSANDEKESLSRERKRVEDEMLLVFSPIDKAMRKYERIIVQNAEIFVSYLKSPVTALDDDEGIAIVPILQHMKKLVADETLGFKDKDQEKMLSRIDAVTHSRLKELRDSHLDVKERLSTVIHDISQHDILRELDDRNYKREHCDNQIQILNEKIDASKKAKDKIDLEALRDSAESMIKEKLSIEVKLTWD